MFLSSSDDDWSAIGEMRRSGVTKKLADSSVATPPWRRTMNCDPPAPGSPPPPPPGLPAPPGLTANDSAGTAWGDLAAIFGKKQEPVAPKPKRTWDMSLVQTEEHKQKEQADKAKREAAAAEAAHAEAEAKEKAAAEAAEAAELKVAEADASIAAAAARMKEADEKLAEAEARLQSKETAAKIAEAEAMLRQVAEAELKLQKVEEEIARRAEEEEKRSAELRRAEAEATLRAAAEDDRKAALQQQKEVEATLKKEAEIRAVREEERRRVAAEKKAEKLAAQQAKIIAAKKTKEEAEAAKVAAMKEKAAMKAAEQAAKVAQVEAVKQANVAEQVTKTCKTNTNKLSKRKEAAVLQEAVQKASSERWEGVLRKCDISLVNFWCKFWDGAGIVYDKTALFFADTGKEKHGIGGAQCAYAALFVASIIVHRVFDGDFSSAMTVGAWLHFAGLFALILQIHSKGSVEGLSKATMERSAMAIMIRLVATTTKNGYIPADSTGDYIYQAGDVMSFHAVMYIWYLMLGPMRRTCVLETTSRLNSVLLLLLCIGYACPVHGHLNGGNVYDIIWMTGLCMDSLAYFPQVRLGGKGMGAYALTGMGLGRVCLFLFWFTGFNELKPKNNALNTVGCSVLLGCGLQVLCAGALMEDYLSNQAQEVKLMKKVAKGKEGNGKKGKK